MRIPLQVYAVLVPSLSSLSTNAEHGPIDFQSEDIEVIGRQSDMSYKGVQTKKVGKRNYKCTFDINFSFVPTPPLCTKYKAKCKPVPKKPITFTIDSVPAVLTVSVQKKKVTRCSVTPSKVVNGEWSSWSSWSACSATCGSATKMRKRTCSNPSPSSGGNPCSGPEEQIEECSNPSCGPDINEKVALLELSVQSLNDSVQNLQTTMQTVLELIGNMQCCTNNTQGWTIIQRRGPYGNAEDFFDKDFNDYEIGFGSVDDELWIGLIKLAALTSDGEWEMQVDLTDFDDKEYHARYNQFSVGPAPTYKLHVPPGGFDDGEFGDSTLGNSLYAHNGEAFSARDKDQDGNSVNCAGLYKGGWWYFGNFDSLGNSLGNTCNYAQLNGLNLAEQTANPGGIRWLYDGNRGKGFKSFKASVMKIRKVKV